MSTVTAEVRGKLRAFKQRHTRNATAIDAARPAMLASASEIVGRQSLKGRSRVFDRLHARLAKHGARIEQFRLEGNVPLALWSYLKPRCSVAVNADPETGATQDCVSLDYILVGSVQGPGTACYADGLWTAEFSDHALHRLLARCPGVDLTAVTFAAHDNLLALPLESFKRAVGADSPALLISAGDGVFIVEARMAPDISNDYKPNLHFRTKTWVHRDQLRPDQIPEPRVTGVQALAHSYLRPKPLREFVDCGPGEGEGESIWKVATPVFAADFAIRASHGAVIPAN